MTSQNTINLPPLALHGGPPTIHQPHPELFHWPIVTDEDEQAVLDVLRAGSMSGTEITTVFEREFAQWMDLPYALATCNGTAALLASMWACGVGMGDEIICPSMTYWASALPAMQLGATVQFADIHPLTLCIDPADIEHRISPRTKAIVVVHYAGHPCDMDAILPIARFEVTDDSLTPIFVPLEKVSTRDDGYGPNGHPKPEARDYSLAWDKRF